mmetsp:Transcript_4997/g.15097  ORF Transcript_4997/g.15097 Transcript_4997/m.15097 type:complete len:205 (+) Transcript_4997:239-853(+)
MQKTFENVTTRVASVRDLDQFLIGHVSVGRNGENAHLATIYEAVAEDKWPTYKVLRRNGHVATFDGDKRNPEELLYFIQSEAGVKLGLGGTIDEFESIAARYAQSRNYDTRQLLLHEADALAAKIIEKDKAHEKTVKNYIKVLHKVATSDEAWLKNEIARVRRLLDTKLSASKKSDMLDRLKILDAFHIKEHPPPAPIRHITEL